MPDLNILIRKALTPETNYWPREKEQFSETMNALGTLMRYELVSKDLIKYPPSLLGDVYQDFKEWNTEAIYTLVIDFYASNIAKNAQGGLHAVLKWMDNNPNQDVASYLRKAIRNFITDLQSGANPEKYSVATHLATALRELLLEGKYIQGQRIDDGKIKNNSLFCFMEHTLDESASVNFLRRAFLKTSDWNEIRQRIYQGSSKIAPRLLTQAFRELPKHGVTCFYYGDAVDALYEEIRIITEPFIKEDAEGESVNAAEEIPDPSPIQDIVIQTHEQFKELQKHTIALIQKQNWHANQKETCIQVFTEMCNMFIDDEDDPGWQRRLALHIRMPPQTVNDYVQRLRKILSTLRINAPNHPL